MESGTVYPKMPNLSASQIQKLQNYKKQKKLQDLNKSCSFWFLTADILQWKRKSFFITLIKDLT
nr:hypothetical protein [uncultured Flavobacterium sp.]